ncbi:hypothetical protein B0H16DRAFT_1494390 [Mycena metata]|uniref:Protein kinase domain-containing protein n=1 Tax=Mycena metata TaxID=1033252 RepID=A0AAD7KE72_9AGAR|nr:hypothetical protein B0H16DRAFT_1494390 [Mycena metata]
MRPQSLPQRLSTCTWGRTHEQFPDLVHSSTVAGRLGPLTLWEALAAADLCLPPFRSASTSKSSANESKASQAIPAHLSLQLVSEDLDWIEDVEAFARQSWENIDKSADQSRRWKTVLSTLKSAPKFWRTLISLDAEGIGKEYNENETDMRTRIEGPTAVLGGGTVKPAVNIKFKSQIDPPLWMNLVRIENKTALVQFAHAVGLQRVVGKRRKLNWDSTSAGVYTQAYAGSFASKTIDDLSASRVVILGNPALWRIAYVLDAEIAITLLPNDARINVHQGHLLRQKLALTAIKSIPEFVRLRPRSQPSTLDVIVDVAVDIVDLGYDMFTRLGEIIFRSPIADLVLGGPRVHARCIGARKEFLEDIRKSPVFQTTIPGYLWTNNSWYIKIPSGIDEVIATRETSLRASCGVVQFAGELVITTGEHRGKVLLVTCAAGEVAGNSGDLIEETLSVAQKSNLFTAILAIHEAGWHHHDIHPANIILSGDDIVIVDFGRAKRASECFEFCQDTDVMASLAISPSSSMGTAMEEELADTFTTIVEVDEDKDPKNRA